MDSLELEKWIPPLVLLLADGLVENHPERFRNVASIFKAVIHAGLRRVMMYVFVKPSSSLKVIQSVKRSPNFWHVLNRAAVKEDDLVRTSTAQLVSSLASGKHELLTMVHASCREPSASFERSRILE